MVRPHIQRLTVFKKNTFYYFTNTILFAVTSLWCLLTSFFPPHFLHFDWHNLPRVSTAPHKFGIDYTGCVMSLVIMGKSVCPSCQKQYRVHMYVRNLLGHHFTFCIHCRYYIQWVLYCCLLSSRAAPLHSHSGKTRKQWGSTRVEELQRTSALCRKRIRPAKKVNIYVRLSVSAFWTPVEEEEEYFFLFCHIHNYTPYNQQGNLCSAFNPSKCTHTWQRKKRMADIYMSTIIIFCYIYIVLFWVLKALYIEVGESPHPPPMCSIHQDDAMAAILHQNAHHTPAYWWRGDRVMKSISVWGWLGGHDGQRPI